MSYGTRDTLKDTARFSGWFVFFSATFIILMMVFSSMAIFGFGFFQRETANFRGETDVIEQTQANADFRIQSYEWYFDQCAAIQAMEGRIDAQRSELDSDPDADRVQQINANIAAMTGQRSALIAEYNGEARKETTSGQFRAGDLPDSIDVNNPGTTCTWADQ